MGKKNALALAGGAGSGIAFPSTLAFPSTDGGGKKRKKHKGGGAGADSPLADEVGDMVYETIGIVGVQKLYFASALEEARKGAQGEAAEREAVRKVAGKHLLGAIIARRMFKRGSLLAIGARSVQAAAAVALANTL